MNHSVKLMHYDPRWKQEFQQTRSSILQSCEGWVISVEHIGSTAIPGLVAQPTIDVLAGVNRSGEQGINCFSAAADLIEGLNFRRCESSSWPNQSVVLQKPRHGSPSHRVFLMDPDDRQWSEAIAIRDHLLSHREQALRFEETKVARWKSGEGDPARYQSDKAIFFTHLADQILSAGE